MHPLRFAAPLALAACLPAAAAVTSANPSGFLVTHRVETRGAPAAVFTAIGQVGRWWSDAHTYSGHASNMRMPLAAGACFCEGWERNSVEHARVIYAAPGKRVRLSGALGPLQEMAVTGILDFRIEPRGTGSTVTLTYRVRGSADAALDKVAPAVDKVLGEQLQRLAAHVDPPPPPAPPERFFDAGGTRVRFIELGQGEPVLLVHDAGLSSEAQWLDTGVMRALAQSFRTVAVDAREAEDLVRLMDHLGFARAHLVGYGAGAVLAARAALAHPERLQTLTLAGAAPREPGMAELPVPTLGIVGMKDPAVAEFIELKRVMPRLARMTAIDGATHETAPSSPDFRSTLARFLRNNPIR